MTVTERLKQLPHHVPEWRVWLDNEQHYDWYARVFAALNPHSVLEIGTCLGYSLAAAALGLPGKDPPPQFTWVDDESYVPNSNELALENIWDVFRERFAEDTAQPPAEAFLRGVRSWDDVEGGFDVVHVDGDHSEEGCRKDLDLSLLVVEDCIIGHDYHLEPGVKAAVTKFCSRYKFDHIVLDDFKHGLFVIPVRSPEPGATPARVFWTLAGADVGTVRRVHA